MKKEVGSVEEGGCVFLSNFDVADKWGEIADKIQKVADKIVKFADKTAKVADII